MAWIGWTATLSSVACVAAERSKQMNAYVAETIAEAHAADLRREAEHARLVSEARRAGRVQGVTSARGTPIGRVLTRLRRVAV